MMNAFKVTLHSGQALAVEDKRTLQQLCTELCSAGFVVVMSRGTGYSTTGTEIALFERAVASIEPV